MGTIHYLAPDTLQWENLEVGYSDFLYWLLTGPIESFYETFNWKIEIMIWNRSMEIIPSLLSRFYGPMRDMIWNKQTNGSFPQKNIMLLH